MNISPSPTNNRRRPTVLGAATLIVTFAAVTAMGVPAHAKRSAVVCGMVLRTNLTLHADLVGCPHHGITIDANNVTLNLNGHTISGSFGGTGIRVRHTGATRSDLVPHENVIVKNGTVTNFQAGVAILNGNHDTVTEMKLLDNRGNDRYGDGILIDGDHNSLTYSDVKRNGPLAGVAILSQLNASSQFNTIQNNIIEDNNVDMECPVPGLCHNEDEGVRIEAHSSDNTIIDNTIAGSGLDGVGVYSLALHNLIKDNDISRNGQFESFQSRPGDGIRVLITADGQKIQGNRIHDNAGHGIALDSYGNVVNHNNLVVDNGTNPNFVSFDGADHEFGCPLDLNTWNNNTIGTGNYPCVK